MEALPRSTLLVLARPFAADPDEVLRLAVADLVEAGAWRHERRRRLVRRFDVILPADPMAELPEPLAYVDALLRATPATGDDGARDLRATAREIARTRPRAGSAAVERTRGDLKVRGLLVRGEKGREPSAEGLALVAAAGLDRPGRTSARRGRRFARGGRELAPATCDAYGPLGLTVAATWSVGCSDAQSGGGGFFGGGDGFFGSGGSDGSGGGGFDGGGGGGDGGGGG